MWEPCEDPINWRGSSLEDTYTSLLQYVQVQRLRPEREEDGP